jgi:hypothetical protein
VDAVEDFWGGFEPRKVVCMEAWLWPVKVFNRRIRG